jgi:molybdenum cofactor biosynthesis enzyme MoaA
MPHPPEKYNVRSVRRGQEMEDKLPSHETCGWVISQFSVLLDSSSRARETNTIMAWDPTKTLDQTHRSSGKAFEPEENPFGTVMVDVTHRCNMACNNCYIPNRQIPDMDAGWLERILARLSRRTRIRLTGAEATLRQDLPDLIRMVRRARHWPVLMTNGLKISDREYLRTLKAAGLRVVYLSCNGGLRDELYQEIDGMRCAGKKMLALEHLCSENMYTSIGMILVEGLNTDFLREFYLHLKPKRPVREFHLRSVGAMGRYMDLPPLTIERLKQLAIEALGARPEVLEEASGESPTHLHFPMGHMRVQLTQWPDLDNHQRGRLTPDGKIEPCFEHILANEGGY